MIALMKKVEKEEFFSEMGKVFEKHADRIIGVVTEAYEDKIKLVIEQFGGLYEAIDDLRQKFTLQEEKIDSVIVDVVVIRSQLKTKADTSEVAALDHCVRVLETKG